MISLMKDCVRFVTVRTGLIVLILAGCTSVASSPLMAQESSILELVPRQTPDSAPPKSMPLDPFGITDSPPVDSPARPNPPAPAEMQSRPVLEIQDDEAEVVPQMQEQEEALPEPALSNENMELLMRAPLHEAFAEVPQRSPKPNPLVTRRPPQAVEEMPPDYKPEGENVVWVPGYWFWDEDRNDFIWISGVWRDAPVGHRWVQGYWHEESGLNGQLGYRWINGFWQPSQTTSLSYLPAPPDPIETGPSMPAPSDDYFYVPGNWYYQQSRYVWRPGFYSVYVPGQVWVPPTYIWTPGGYLFRPGYWDKPLDCRGVVFAPVYFRQPIYLQPAYVYQPTCVIETGLAILPHLFVRRDRCHYYFGDWYAERYVSHGFLGWSSLDTYEFYHRLYDPLFVFYSSPIARRNNRSLVYWALQQHRHCSLNEALRPATVFDLNYFDQTDLTHRNAIDVLPTEQVFLADRLERKAELTSNNRFSRTAQRLIRIDQRQQESELEAINRQLQKQRREAEQELAKTARLRVQPASVQLVSTGSSANQTRQAYLKQEASRELETRWRVQQKQAEDLASVQAAAWESDLSTVPQFNDQPRPELIAPVPQGIDAVDGRQLPVYPWNRAIDWAQQERQQRRILEYQHSQLEAAQRLAAEAARRQQAFLEWQSREAFGLPQRPFSGMYGQAESLWEQVEQRQRQAAEAFQRQRAEMQRASERSLRQRLRFWR